MAPCETNGREAAQGATLQAVNAPDNSSTRPDIVVVMGVSGSGKTTVGLAVAAAMGWPFAEGDDFHPAANVAKMRDGHPLTDEDRWPWLETIGEWIDAREQAGESAVVSCSALRRAYRDVLRRGRPDVRFLHIVVPPGVIQDRMDHREGHFMPTSLLESQLETLEPLEADEPGVVVTNEGTAAEVLDRSLAALGLRGQAGSR
jgi:gluconokinase